MAINTLLFASLPGLAPCSSSIACGARYSYSSSSSQSLTIMNCVFQYLSNSGSGGSIYISDSLCNLTVSASIFSSCTSTTTTGYSGGAIYFVGYNFSMGYSCGYNNTAYDGQFVYAQSSQRESLMYSAYSLCSTQALQGLFSACRLEASIQQVFFVNTSFDYVSSEGAAFQMYGSAPASVSFMCAVNDTSSVEVIWFYSCVSSTISLSNVISCTSSPILGTKGTGSVTVSNCSFSGNSGTPVFSCLGTSSYISVKNCFVSAASSSVCGQNVTTANVASSGSTVACFKNSLFSLSETTCILPWILSSSVFTFGFMPANTVFYLVSASMLYS